MSSPISLPLPVEMVTPPHVFFLVNDHLEESCWHTALVDLAADSVIVFCWDIGDESPTIVVELISWPVVSAKTLDLLVFVKKRHDVLSFRSENWEASL